MEIEYSKEALRFLEYLYQQGKVTVSHSMLPAEIEKPSVELLHVMAGNGHIKIIREIGQNLRYQIKDAGIAHIECWRADQAEKQKTDMHADESLKLSKEANQIAQIANQLSEKSNETAETANTISEEANKIARRASRYSFATLIVSLLALAVSIAGLLLSFFR